MQGNLTEPFHADLLQAIMDQLSILTEKTYSLSAWRRALGMLSWIDEQRGALPVTRLPLADGIREFERAASGQGVKFLLEP